MNPLRLFGEGSGSVGSPRINRAPSPLLALTVPWLSVVLASVLPTLPTIASAPLLPPFGFLVFIAWRQLRPGLLPVWSGLPLGFIDDLYSGQPMGSAVLLWSSATIALEIIEARLPWRHFAMEWVVACGMIVGYLGLSLALSNAAGGSAPFVVLMPQLLLSILLYPLVGRVVSALDRFRLLAIRDLS